MQNPGVINSMVNSPYFSQKISTCPVLCCILTLSVSRVAWAYLELLYIKINIFFSRPRRAFFKIVCGLYDEMLRNYENSSLEIRFQLVTFSKYYFDLYFYAWIVANRKTRRSSPCAASVRKKLKFLWPTVAFFELSEYSEANWIIINWYLRHFLADSFSSLPYGTIVKGYSIYFVFVSCDL